MVLKEGERRVGDLGACVVIGGMARGGKRAVAGIVRTGFGAPTLIAQPATVPKLCQNPIYLAGKGINFELAGKGINFERKQNPRNHISTWEEKG